MAVGYGHLLPLSLSPPPSAKARVRSSFHIGHSCLTTSHFLTTSLLPSSTSPKSGKLHNIHKSQARSHSCNNSVTNSANIRRKFLNIRNISPTAQIRSSNLQINAIAGQSPQATLPIAPCHLFLFPKNRSFVLFANHNQPRRSPWQCRSGGEEGQEGGSQEEGIPCQVEPRGQSPSPSPSSSSSPPDISHGSSVSPSSPSSSPSTPSPSSAPHSSAATPPVTPKGENNHPNSWFSWIRVPQIDWSRIGGVLLFFLQSFIVALILHVSTRLFPKSWLGGATWRPPQAPPPASVSVPFSEFLHQVEKRHVSKVQVDGERLTFTVKPEVIGKVPFKGAESVEPGTATWSTIRPGDLATPYSLLISKNVEFGAPDKRSLHLLNSVSVGLLYAGLVVALLGRLPLKFPQQRSTGRTRGKRSGSSGNRDRNPTVLFADVAGVDEAKEELEEIVEYLREPQRFIQLGARPPRGVLLVGPPGTGKTLLAKAVAGEANVPFISCAASEFVELYVGLGAARVRDLFARAKKDAPSIVFIDEIDAVAKGRDGRLRSMGNDEREQTLNQLLTELDGFDSGATVVVLAATNRADVLDPALRRPGRFDRIVPVEAPDRVGREAILGVHIRKNKLPLSSDVHIPSLAAATAGFTGADLANIVNEAALLAARARKQVVGREEFEQAVERSRGGIEKKRSTLGRSEKGVVARHEVGHALVGAAVSHLLPAFPLAEKLSIIPRSGGALGFTYMPPPSGEERNLLFIDEVKGRLVVLLGGRAAEEVAFRGRVSTGALDDIRRATDVAYKAVAEYGLSATVGPLSLATLSGGGFDDSGGGAAFPWGKDQGHVTALVQKEACALLRRALLVARCVLTSNVHILEGLGACLEVEEKVQGSELSHWLSQVHVPPELTEYVTGNSNGNVNGEVNGIVIGSIDEISRPLVVSEAETVVIPDGNWNIETASS